MENNWKDFTRDTPIEVFDKNKYEYLQSLTLCEPEIIEEISVCSVLGMLDTGNKNLFKYRRKPLEPIRITKKMHDIIMSGKKYLHDDRFDNYEISDGLYTIIDGRPVEIIDEN